jgi:transposase
MMGHVNKTDKLDAKGLAKLLHLDSLPTVWLPPGEIRDERELHRTRMAVCKLRTALKDRMHATLAKYGMTNTEHSDIFVGGGRAWLETTLSRLPAETGRCVAQELEALDALTHQIAQFEKRIRERVALTPSIQLLKSLPGIGAILAIVIEREIGSIDRFGTAGQLASYAGVVPTVHASGGKTRFGHMRKPPTSTSSGLSSKPPTSSSATGTTPPGRPSMSAGYTTRSVSERATPSPSAPWLAIWQRHPSGC